MAKEPARDPILDERLARLGREWFAEVRRTDADEAKAREGSRDGEGVGGLIDALFGGDAGDGEADGTD